MYKSLFIQVKKLIPRISSTELIALRSGNVSLDRQIMKGMVELPTKQKIESKFPKENLDKLFKVFSKKPLNSKIYPDYPDIIHYLAKNKYFSFLIDEKYASHPRDRQGGRNFTDHEGIKGPSWQIDSCQSLESVRA